MQRPLAAHANANYLSAFVEISEELGTGATRRFGSVTATSTGLPLGSFNRAFVLEPSAEADIIAAVEWLFERDDPFWLTATDATVEQVDEIGADRGWERIESQPGMVLDPLESVPSPKSAAEIVRVSDRERLTALVEVFAAAFGVDLEIADRAYAESFLAHERLQLFVGYVDGKGVACGMLYRTEEAAGVYSIGVVEEHRRRGIGTDMTWSVLDAGKETGCSIGVLQSSEAGYPLYEGVGFETAITYHHFGPGTDGG